jgi:uncharacterized protein YbbC (DUF1343 family)
MFPLFKKSLIALFSILVLASCSSFLNRKKNVNTNSTTVSLNSTEEQLKLETKFTDKSKTGADNYETYLPSLKDKKIGIVTNQTGIVLIPESSIVGAKKTQKHLVDFLLEKNIQIQTIFAPEHGFRGTADAGELIVDGKDTKTGLPIISLYGDNKKPKQEQLQGIDIMIFDIQDVGARFYTYISSLHYVMEACAENNIPLLILDRPNPNGSIIDGPILETAFTSFVGMHPIPILHGMTIGEYAQMINGEKWLKDSIQCTLTVVPCLYYHRNMLYSLPVRPSPNLPNDQAINLYASLCLFEGTNVSVGRGTEKQFQIYGSPYLPKNEFSFIPAPNLGSKNPLYKGITCFGEDLSSHSKIHELELKWLLKAYHSTEDKTKFFNPFFTKLAGTKTLQLQIEEGLSEKKIRKSWKIGIEQFKEMRKKYLIY